MLLGDAQLGDAQLASDVATERADEQLLVGVTVKLDGEGVSAAGHEIFGAEVSSVASAGGTGSVAWPNVNLLSGVKSNGFTMAALSLRALWRRRDEGPCDAQHAAILLKTSVAAALCGAPK